MDRLDAWGVGVVAVLLGSAAALNATQPPDAHSTTPRGVAVLTPAAGQGPAALTRARHLMEADSVTEAERLVDGHLQAHPDDAAAHVLRAELWMRRQDPLAAVLEYRRAVLLEPDYLDRRTPLYQGGRMKTAMQEGTDEVARRQAAGTQPEQLKVYRQAIHSLHKRLEGSCG